MKQATLIAPEGWKVLSASEQHHFIQSEFGDDAGRNILAIARKNDADGVFALLEYRQTGYIENPSLQQVDERALIQKANEDLHMLNQENGFSDAETVRWKGFVLKPRFDAQRHILEYGVELRFGDLPAVNLYQMQLLRNGVLVLTLVGMPEDKLNFKGWQYKFDSAWKYENYQPSRDRKSEGTLANLMLMNRFI